MIEIETKYLQVMKLLYTIQCDQCIMIKVELWDKIVGGCELVEYSYAEVR